MFNHAKVPQFDMEKMPFVIFNDEGGFYLVNIKTCTVQLLVKTERANSGFCLELEDGSFDFHFTHTFTDENKNLQEAHHRV